MVAKVDLRTARWGCLLPIVAPPWDIKGCKSAVLLN